MRGTQCQVPIVTDALSGPGERQIPSGKWAMEFMILCLSFSFLLHHQAGTQELAEGMAKVTGKVQMAHLLFIEQNFFVCCMKGTVRGTKHL